MILVHEKELECIRLSIHLLMKSFVIIVPNSVLSLFEITIFLYGVIKKKFNKKKIARRQTAIKEYLKVVKHKTIHSSINQQSPEKN